MVRIRVVSCDFPNVAALPSPAGKSSRVPQATDSAVRGGHRFRHPINHAVVDTQTEGHSPRQGQWNVVPGKVNSLEPVVFLKISETVVLLFAVREIRIP